MRMAEANPTWGAPRIHGELLKLGFDVSQASVSRYMPRRSYPPSQSWRSFLRNQTLGFGTIGPGEAGRISDQLLAFVRGWIERIVPCATKVRDGISCRLSEPPWIAHPADRRTIRGGWRPVRPRRIATGGDHGIIAGRRLSPYRSRASPQSEAVSIHKVCTIIRRSRPRRLSSPIFR